MRHHHHHPAHERQFCLIIVTAASICSLLLAACGIPLDDEPQIIASEDLPRSIQPNVPDDTSAPTLPIRDSEVVTIYLVDPAEGDAGLVPVVRQVPEGGAAAEVEQATLQLLLDGPSSDEQLEQNLTTLLLPSGDAPIGLISIDHPVPGQASIVLSDTLGIEGGDRVAAFAQIVFTLTEFPQTSSVRFLVRSQDGEDEFIPVKTDTEEGDVTRAVNRDDYLTLLPTRLPG